MVHGEKNAHKNPRKRLFNDDGESETRQIVSFDVAVEKTSPRIQAMVDSAPPSKRYCTAWYVSYVDVIFPGKHVRNLRDKSDTSRWKALTWIYAITYPLSRKSWCFARRIETLRAVLKVFVDAFKRFGRAKLIYRQTRHTGEIPFSSLDGIIRYMEEHTEAELMEIETDI